jgi:hypothetical protein
MARVPCHTCSCCLAGSGVKESSERRDHELLHAAHARVSVINKSWRRVAFTFTNRGPPQQDGAASFRRLLGRTSKVLDLISKARSPLCPARQCTPVAVAHAPTRSRSVRHRAKCLDAPTTPHLHDAPELRHHRTGSQPNPRGRTLRLRRHDDGAARQLLARVQLSPREGRDSYLPAGSLGANLCVSEHLLAIAGRRREM